jgi:predicted acylesterase/phospholipase RssA
LFAGSRTKVSQAALATNEEGARSTAGLCLSGGGFRAALYGLGVMRYLAENGRLQRQRVGTGLRRFRRGDI